MQFDNHVSEGKIDFILYKKYKAMSEEVMINQVVVHIYKKNYKRISCITKKGLIIISNFSFLFFPNYNNQNLSINSLIHILLSDYRFWEIMEAILINKPLPL